MRAWWQRTLPDIDSSQEKEQHFWSLDYAELKELTEVRLLSHAHQTSLFLMLLIRMQEYRLHGMPIWAVLMVHPILRQAVNLAYRAKVHTHMFNAFTTLSGMAVPRAFV